ncbi:MAG: FAD-dependent oxidoreductase, partial [Devosiaceae bacterium]|nr:FAD-dependent oxidoreductase [Devosiaceae bacterium MH13]
LRTLDDALALRERLADHREVIVVGAGYIGLEAAASARALGAAVTVIDREERLMQRTASPAMSAYFKGLHERKGVDFVLGGALEQLTLDGQRWTARLEGGATLEGDLVIAGIGVVPRTALAEEAGLTVEDGIVTDEHGRTSDPSIFAAGDCVRHAHTKHAQLVRFESVQSAIDQAKVVAANILGEAAQHSATPWFWSDQYDAKLQVVGTLEPDLDVLRRGEPASGSFAIYHLRGPVPVAVEAVNAPQDFVRARKAIAGGLPLDEAFLSDLTSV